MNIILTDTLEALKRKLTGETEVSLEELHRAYNLTIKLRGQLLSVIYEQEPFRAWQDVIKLAGLLTEGDSTEESVTLTIHEPLPSMKELTASVQDHWLEMVQAAIGKAARERKLPYFDRAFVWIDVVTPRGTNNAQLWDTSNRAVNLVINNLKGAFFDDDNYEHMAFGVTGRWGEEGVTIIRVMALNRVEKMVFSPLFRLSS